jgi:hypothetical protein
MRINELNVPVQPDTYEASMFLTQAIRAGKYAIKIHNLLSNDQEMESWVAKKIDLASGYINGVAEYLSTEKIYKEDAGEGHMSKSQLYSIAKSALAITVMVQPGDDIEGWVQTKMNRAVDMLDAVYHYEDYQRLNPYREEIGDLHSKHAEIVKKNIDEILATETPVDDIETKPGMLNILKKRVHQFEKERAQENRKTNEAGSRMPSSMVKTKAKLDSMSPDEIRAFFKKREDFAKQHAGGVIRPGFSAKELAQGQEFRYGREFAKRNPYSKHFESTQKPYVSQAADGKWNVLDKDGKTVFSSGNYNVSQDYFKKNYDNLKEIELDEGLKDWLQRIAAAGIIVGSVAGIGSINNAMDNSVPVIQAMNKALDVANQKGDQQMIQNIKQDIETAKISLNSGQNLNTVKNMQDRYSKFMPTEYKKENESFKDRIMGKIMSPIKDYNKSKESMLPKSAFAGSNKHKLGPAAHLTGKMKRPARAGDLVGGDGESITYEQHLADNLNMALEVTDITEKQDACYHKVKSRYKVWPSAYASGALSKCRKVGAANWGNKSQ